MGTKATEGFATPLEESVAAELVEELHTVYGSEKARARVARAPFRVCPLGAHVDHQLGQVTGMALDRSVLLAFAPSGSSECRLRSHEFPGEVVFDLEAVPSAEPRSWGNYARGAALAMRRGHTLRDGIVGVIHGMLPVGGVSSSSAVGVAYLLALGAVNGIPFSPEELIEQDRFVENSYIGLQNGILDQSVILLAKRDCLLHLDCRTRDHKTLSFGGDSSRFRILIVHSGIQRALVGTDYNTHVAECREAALALLRRAGEPVPEDVVLGIVPSEVFEAYHSTLPEPLRRRALHFFDESRRVVQGLDAWRAGDLDRFGALMNESCTSSIHQYRCGCPELIALFETIRSREGVYGCRFSGAGYGGCCVTLVDADREEAVATAVREAYLQAYLDRRDGFAVFSCRPADGAGVVGEVRIP